MQRFIHEDMDVADDVEAASVHYTEPGSAQYATAAAYGFPTDANEYIAIDQSLDASTSFPATDNKLLQGITLAEQNGHETIIHANGDLETRDGSTSEQRLSLIAPKRKSPDGHIESAPMSGDSKRKRSKVSRACDQCRKKKIRCDADADGSNQLRTCSNCQKTGQICEYSRVPQKRGPSKGYIKELSERVQQVEGQLALQNSTSYRSSLDGQLGAFDTPFSPDDDGTYKNRNSFSQQRSPFADFTRDRFPSVGGWNSGSLTSNPRQQSIAVPPDQVGPLHEKPTSSSSLKPFWSEWIESPTKKRKTSAGADGASNMDQAVLSDYNQMIHPLCPILPDDEQITIGIVALANDEYRDTLLDVLSRLKPSSTVDWQDYDVLEKFVNGKAREPFTSRSDVDSLLLVWIEILLLVILQHNISGWTNKTLPECDLIRMALDHCDDFFKIKPHVTELQNEAAWLRVAYVSAMFARLYAISRGESSDPVPGSVRRQLNINVRVLPPRAIFLVQMTDSLQSCLSLLPEPGGTSSKSNVHEWGRMHSSNLRAWLNAAGLAIDDPIVAEVRAFGELLSLRCSTSLGRSRPAIVGPAVNLAEAIRLSTAAESETAGEKYLFNPLSMHTTTVATLTILELMQCDFDDATSGAMVTDAVQEMRQALSALSEKASQIPSGRNCTFWASVLLDMVDERLKVRTATTPQKQKGEEEKIGDLTLLLSRGYALPLLAYASRQP